MQRRGRAIAAALVAGAMVLAGGGVAVADDLIIVDELVPGSSSNLQLGTVDCGEGLSATVDLKLERRGNTPGGAGTTSPVFANSTAVSITKTAEGTGVDATDPSPATITTPSTWTSATANTTTSAVITTISVDTAVEGDFASSVSFTASGTNTKGGTHSDVLTVNVSWSVENCVQPDTTAPVVTLTCPETPVMLGSTAFATWTASDETGFASGATTSGTVPLETSTYGAGTASVPLGLVSDAAGNPSAAQSCGYFVTEDIEPVVVIDCPTDDVLLGDAVSVGWTASDEGGSGLATAASGTLALDTSAYGPASVTLPAGTAKDNAGNESVEVTCEYFVTETTPPVVTLVCPTGPFLLGESVADAEWTAVDPTPGSGIDETLFDVSGSIAIDTSSVGPQTISVPAGTVEDRAGNVSLVSNECSFSVVYDWDGFFRPVDGGTTVNSVKAGSAIPIKFSLGGDQGLDIFDSTLPNPKITFTTCQANVNVDAVEVTINAGGSSLSYDPVADQYVYVWKTDKAWTGRCGTFSLKLDDGTTHGAKFLFVK